MKEISEKKLMVLIPIVAVLIAFVFSIVVIPMIYSSPKNIPIAIINLDDGIKMTEMEINAGKQIIDKVTATNKTASNNPIKWIIINNQEEINEGFDNGDFYAALIIPANFSKMQSTLQTDNPQSSTLTLEINQGRNTTVATLVETMVNKMIVSLNSNMQPIILKNIQNTKKAISDGQASTYLNPIIVDVNYINKIGDNMANGNAHVATFLITWIVTLFSGLLMYLLISKTKADNKKSLLIKKTLKISYGILLSIFIGLIVSFIAKIEFGLAIPFLSTMSFISIASLSLILLILGTLSITGIKGIIIFVLIMFLGMLSANIPYELLPTVWQNWVYPWVPTRFLTGGFQDIYYLGKGIFNHNTIALMWMGFLGLILFGLSFFKKSNRKN